MSYKIVEKADGSQEVQKIDKDIIKQIKQNDWHDKDFQDYISWLNTGEQPEFISWTQQQIDALQLRVASLETAQINKEVNTNEPIN